MKFGPFSGGNPFSYAALAAIFVNAVRKHGQKVFHLGDVGLLTRDLGKALKEQHKTLRSSDLGTIETMKELLPQLAEVKVLTYAVTKKLGIDTTGKPPLAVFEEIISKTEANGSTAAKDIKESMSWIKAFFGHPEVQDLLKEESVRIERPKSAKEFLTTAFQISAKVNQEISRLHGFLKIAKSADFDAVPPPSTPTSATASDDKPSDSKEPPKPSSPPPAPPAL